jgi:hypothetical protein
VPPKESILEFEEGRSLDEWIKKLKTGDAKARSILEQFFYCPSWGQS